MLRHGQAGLLSFDERFWELMAWSVPRYSKTQVDKAGKWLIGLDVGFDLRRMLSPALTGEMLEIVNNWRASHWLPLHEIRRTLEQRAKRVSPHSVVAQRLKRLTSIQKKLADNEYRHMKLTQIQDIGGCRAVMPTIGDVAALVELYKDGTTKSQLLGSPRDYIMQPKPDGYRSVHLIYDYRSTSAQRQVFNGHRIEIQIRSQLQHAWATAVEMLFTFTGIPVRAIGGSVYATLPRNLEEISRWQRFFLLASSAFAMIERQPLTPNTPASREELVDELRTVSQALDSDRVLRSWRLAVHNVDVRGDYVFSHYLLKLDPEQRIVDIKGFEEKDYMLAFIEYMESEQAMGRDAPSTNVVLVSVDSLKELQSGYPNYYGDAEVFLAALQQFTFRP